MQTAFHFLSWIHHLCFSVSRCWNPAVLQVEWVTVCCFWNCPLHYQKYITEWSTSFLSLKKNSPPPYVHAKQAFGHLPIQLHKRRISIKKAEVHKQWKFVAILADKSVKAFSFTPLLKAVKVSPVLGHFLAGNQRDAVNVWIAIKGVGAVGEVDDQQERAE